MKSSTLVATLGVLVLPQMAHAQSIGTAFSASYESIDIKESGIKMNHNGFNLGLMLEVSMANLAPLDIIAGAGLKYSRLKDSRTVEGVNVDSVVSIPMISLEAGLGGFVVPGMVSLTGILGYDFGVMAKAESEAKGTTTKTDIDSSGRLNVGLRAMYSLDPGWDVGLGLSFLSGNIKFEKTPEADVSGWDGTLFVRKLL